MPRGVPDLDADDRFVEDAGTDHGIEGIDSCRVAADEPFGDGGLDDASGHDRREAAGIADGLVGRDAVDGERAEHGHEGEGREPGQDKGGDRTGDRRAAGHGAHACRVVRQADAESHGPCSRLPNVRLPSSRPGVSSEAPR